MECTLSALSLSLLMLSCCFLFFLCISLTRFEQLVYFNFSILSLHIEQKRSTWNLCFNLIQVVRYHSLVVDPDSLPKELIPIAWTSSHETRPFLGIQNCVSYLDGSERQACPENFAKSLSTKSENGLQWHSSNSQEVQTKNILMGIMHCSRPHYGLQVNFILYI